MSEHGNTWLKGLAHPWKSQAAIGKDGEGELFAVYIYAFRFLWLFEIGLHLTKGKESAFSPYFQLGHIRVQLKLSYDEDFSLT